MGELKCYLPFEIQLGSFLVKEPNVKSLVKNCVKIPENTVPIKIIGKQNKFSVVFNDLKIFAIFPTEYLESIYKNNPDFVDVNNNTPIEESNVNSENNNNNFIFKIIDELSELKDNELIIVYQ